MTRLSYTYENKYSHRLNRGISLWRSNSVYVATYQAGLGCSPWYREEKSIFTFRIFHLGACKPPTPNTLMGVTLTVSNKWQATVGRLHSPQDTGPDSRPTCL